MPSRNLPPGDSERFQSLIHRTLWFTEWFFVSKTVTGSSLSTQRGMQIAEMPRSVRYLIPWHRLLPSIPAHSRNTSVPAQSVCGGWGGGGVQLRCIIGCFRESPGECCRELGQCFGTSAIVPQYASPFHHSLVSHFTYTQHPRATPKCHSQLESHRNQQWIMCSHSTAGSKHIPVTLFQIVPVGKTQPVTLSALETSEKIYESFDRCSQHLLRNQILSP